MRTSRGAQSKFDWIVRLVTNLRDGGSGVRIPVGANIYLSSKTSRLAMGPTQPPTQWVQGFCPGGKAAGA